MVALKEYDLIVIGSGSVMNLVDPLLQQKPEAKIAVIDKDEPGGICLTRGCIPSKILLYPAEMVRRIEEARDLGVISEFKKIDFPWIMERMRKLIYKDIDSIRSGLSSSPSIDYYHSIASFVSPYTLGVEGETIRSKMIFLCTGSKITIPKIEGIEEVNYLTSDTILKLEKLPESIIIVGGGYIAAEYGHFLSSMGSKVTVIGRNPRFLPDEEPEVSILAQKELSKHMKIATNKEVKKMESGKTKKVIAEDRRTGKKETFEASEVMIATGRGPTSDILQPELGGVKTTKEGWIAVNEYLETSLPNVWALGDATGHYLFKHVANYESELVYNNAILKKRVPADYHAIPHAVFTFPEIASVAMGEEEATKKFGKENILIGYYKYENTAKGEAMNAKDYFVKVILEEKSYKILGAHIIGPEASVLVQEIINVMYTNEGAQVINSAMHIHPALNEVVQRAFSSLYSVDQYHEMLSH